jgi:integrase
MRNYTVSEQQERRVRFTIQNVLKLTDGKWTDTEQTGLGVWVRHSGASRIWLHRYRYANLPYATSLGPVTSLTPQEARTKVVEQRAGLAKGIRPISAKAQARAATAKATKTPDAEGVIAGSFKADAKDYCTFRADWDAKQRHDFEASMRNHVFPTIGDRQTADLKGAELRDALLPHWKPGQTKNSTGPRLVQRVRAVIQFAIDNDDEKRFPDKVNVAAGLLRRLPKHKQGDVAHMRALKWEEMPALYSRLCGWTGSGSGNEADPDGMAGHALRFLIACCSPRAAEVFQMRVGEIKYNQWHVPGDHVKGRVSRIIPLSDEALSVLHAIIPADAKPTDYVFTGKAGGRIGHQRMRRLLAHFGYDYDVHGTRSTVKSWVMDNLKHPLDLPAIEIAADHTIGNAVQESYRDTSLLAHRRILAERYAAFLTGVAYTGRYEASPMSLVVDNSAVA